MGRKMANKSAGTVDFGSLGIMFGIGVVIIMLLMVLLVNLIGEDIDDITWVG